VNPGYPALIGKFRKGIEALEEIMATYRIARALNFQVYL
jgi:hypothetical protein